MSKKIRSLSIVDQRKLNIEQKIFSLRGKKVMLDADLAEIYGVETKTLNRAVRRNIDRFPEDFMFQLNAKEAIALRCQIGTSNNVGRGGRRYLPYVFTEHGAVMLASVLNSATAVTASMQVVRAFIRFRSILGTHKELAHKLDELEKKYDAQFFVVFKAIKKLMGPPPKTPKSKRKFGF
jgi:hypothetical protein